MPLLHVVWHCTGGAGTSIDLCVSKASSSWISNCCKRNLMLPSENVHHSVPHHILRTSDQPGWSLVSYFSFPDREHLWLAAAGSAIQYNSSLHGTDISTIYSAFKILQQNPCKEMVACIASCSYLLLGLPGPELPCAVWGAGLGAKGRHCGFLKRAFGKKRTTTQLGIAV